MSKIIKETENLIIDIDTEILDQPHMFVILVTKKITHKDTGRAFKTKIYQEEILKDLKEPFLKTSHVKREPVLINPTPEIHIPKETEKKKNVNIIKKSLKIFKKTQKRFGTVK